MALREQIRTIKGALTADANQQGLALFRITGDQGFLRSDLFYTTTFTTLNGSGVTGEAIIGYDIQTNTITVAISAAGLEPNQVHIQHIHGFPDGRDATTPTLEQDVDGDGFIELAEGLPKYGPILLNLSTNHGNGSGSDNGHSHGELAGFPTAPDGRIWFVESYQLPAGDLGADPMLALREIVLHGLTVPEGVGAGAAGPAPNEVDGTGGYKLVLPVASGELTQVTSVAQLRSFIDDTDFDLDAALYVSRPGNSGPPPAMPGSDATPPAGGGNGGQPPTTPGNNALPPAAGGNGGQPATSPANPQSDGRVNNFMFDISKSGGVSRDLGDAQDRVWIKSDETVQQIRITFTSSEVGNGVATDGNTLANQDGGLAVRVQVEGSSDNPNGAVSRFDDEGITFTTTGDATFDVRDLVSGTARGDQFDVVILGTKGADTFNEAGSSEAYYINAGMGDDTLTGGLPTTSWSAAAATTGSTAAKETIASSAVEVRTCSSSPALRGTTGFLDFVSGTDKIDLSAFGITSANVSTAASGANTIVSVDSDQNGTADFQITLVNAAAPATGDFFF
jgi:hypothetical protein